MKLVALLLLLGFFHPSPPALLLLDTSYRTTPTKVDDFTWDMYTNERFPVYADDRKAIIDAAKKLARLIDNDPNCGIWDTTAANHSRFIVSVQCGDYKTYTVRFQTIIKEKSLNCNIELANKETDPKKAQRKIIDFASYLEENQ
jgi:hypothetical protein